MRTFYKKHVVGLSDSPEAVLGKTSLNFKDAMPESINRSFSSERPSANIVTKVIGSKADDMNVRQMIDLLKN
jgi:hypothetical protein